MAELKDILKKLRSEKNMSQAVLAQELGAGLSTVASWEVGKRYPSRENMEQLSDLFNVDIDYLYGRTDVRQAVHFDRDGQAMVYLSADEYLLIEHFRSLTAAGQDYIIQTMAIAMNSYKRDESSVVKRA